MMTWQVEGNHVLEADKNAYETDLSRKSILKFLKETNTSQRAVFVEEFFNVLAEMNISSVTEFSGPVVISKIMSRMSRMDDEAKSTAGKMIRAFTDNISSDLQKSISDSTEQIRNRFFRKKADDAEIKLNQEKETLEEETTEL
jgi:paraquat-inducible protein B